MRTKLISAFTKNKLGEEEKLFISFSVFSPLSWMSQINLWLIGDEGSYTHLT